MQQLLQDLKFGLRILAKTPGVTVIILLSLALGIGANATVLCWIQKILWDPIPGAVHPEQIVGLVSNQGSGNTSLPDIRDLGALQTVFAGAVASQISPASLTFNEQTDWVFGQVATANLFELLGVKPVLGRTFLPDEDLKPGGNPVLVISETLWRRRFGGDPKVLGQVVKINRLPYTIIGVTPRVFKGTMTGLGCDFWAPISMYDQVGGRADDILYRNSRGFHNFARLQPGVTIEQAQAAVSLLDSQLGATYPDTNREVHHRVVPYSKVPYGAQQILGPALRILLAVSLGVLLIVAANVANLLLARAISRQKEIAIRLSAGASRWQLVRQMLTESIFLSLLGGAGGILVASWGGLPDRAISSGHQPPGLDFWLSTRRHHLGHDYAGHALHRDFVRYYSGAKGLSIASVLYPQGIWPHSRRQRFSSPLASSPGGDRGGAFPRPSGGCRIVLQRIEESSIYSNRV